MGKNKKFNKNHRQNLNELKEAVENASSSFSNQASFDSMQDHAIHDADIETHDNTNESKWPDVLGIAIIALLLIGITSTAINRGDDSDPLSNVANPAASIGFEEDEDMLTVTKIDEEGNESDVMLLEKDPSVSVNSSSQFTKIKLAVIESKGESTCDDVVKFVDREIIPTRAPLNASLKELFKNDVIVGFNPGNFIGTQKELSFKEATLENGVASIFLGGQVGPYDDECDKTRVFTQIRETALQFSTVSDVEFYLDGIKLEY